MVVSSYLVLQWIHLALLVRVGGMFFREDFISGSVNLKLGAPRFSGSGDVCGSPSKLAAG